jgi:DNA polymerase III sliding clamp (beta) subunit (PCNA family)
MKITIPQKALLEVLNKGAIAALSEVAQKDVSSHALLIRSAKITATDKEIIVESYNEFLAIKHIIPANKEKNITVIEAGCIVVPAKELVNWAKLQGTDTLIGMNYQPLASPEMIIPKKDKDDGTNSDKAQFAVTKIGTIRLSSKKNDTSKTLGKWDLDVYDSKDVPSVDFVSVDKNFEIKGETLIEAVNSVGFARLDNDYDHIFDAISIQIYDNSLYFAATNREHCALYKFPTSSVEIVTKNALLIPATLLEQASSIINKGEKVAFSYDVNKEKIFISQPDLMIRVASTKKQHISKFPNIELLFKRPYHSIAEISVATLSLLLTNASLVNSKSALFAFSKNEGILAIKAISDNSKYKPTIKQSNIGNITEDVRSCWGVSHIMSLLKIIKESEVELHIPEAKNSLKIIPKGDGNWIYFIMSIDNQKLINSKD